MRNCCKACFKDEQLQNIVKNTVRIGNCAFCGSKNVKVYPLGDPNGTQEIEDLLLPVLDLYVPAKPKSSGRSLSRALIEDWDIFNYSSPRQVTQFLQTAYPYKTSSNPIKLVPVVLNVTKDDDILKGQSWEDFTDCIKHKNRFFVKDMIVDKFEDFLEPASIEYGKKTPFYRARIGTDPKGYKTADMGAPPSNRALPGRINPQGISELYLAKDEDTALREVRPSLYDYVTLGVLYPKDQIRVVDLSRFARISPFKYTIDISVIAANRVFIQGMSTEVAHIMRRGDDDIEYIPTQYIAEFIKRCGYDGVQYNSTVSENGVNVCIFNPEKFACIGVLHKTVSDIQYQVQLI